MVARGACVVVGGVVAGGMWGVHGCTGYVVAGGHAWLLGGVHACQGVGGVHGCQGACVVAGGACVGYDKIRSMSGRYASYWNAFLFITIFGFNYLELSFRCAHLRFDFFCDRSQKKKTLGGNL